MTHKMMVNASNKAMRHPETGQAVMPGQQYLVPDDAESIELIDASLPWIAVQSVADPDSTAKAIASAKKSSKKADDAQ